MPIKKTDADSGPIDIKPIRMESLIFFIVGRTPLILNEQSEKSRQQLLLPPPKKNQAERQQTLKHNPREEYKDSAYKSDDPECPTLLILPENSPKKALAQAAIDVPGAAKAVIGRLVSMPDLETPVWGIPMLRADMVRQAGMNKTPDVRFRCCLGEWAAVINLNYLATKLTPSAITNLLDAAGQIVGIGDWRVEKGSGEYGKFRIVAEDDPDFLRIVTEGGRATQEAAIFADTPPFFNEKTRKLVTWFDEELARRARVPTNVATRRGKYPVGKDGGKEPDDVADLVAAAVATGERSKAKRNPGNGARA